MPAKNSVKQFVENGYYHVYNRGVEKRDIFLDSQDYYVFLGYLKKYLDPTTVSDPKSLADEVELIAYCLMPNHFHLLVKQKTIDGLTKLMRAVCTKYVMYFNTKYKRVGTLFQGKYKAVLILTDEYLLHLTRYIHLNPGSDPDRYLFSSYNCYIGKTYLSWVKPEVILNYFKPSQPTSITDHLYYQNFVESYTQNDSEDVLGDLVLEHDHLLGSDPKHEI